MSELTFIDYKRVMVNSPDDFKDEKLQNSFHAFFIELVDLLNQVPEENYPSTMEMEVNENESGREASRYSVVNYEKLVAFTSDVWTDLQEFSELASTVHESTIYTGENFFGSMTLNEEDHLRRNVIPQLASQLFRGANDIQFDEEVFRRVYQEFEEVLLAESYEYVTWAPLRNFSMENNRLQLNSNLIIREITPSERGQIHSTSLSPLGFTGMNEDYVVESRFTISPRQKRPINIHEGEEEIKKVTTALRLYSGDKKPFYINITSEPGKPLYSTMKGGRSFGEYDRPPVGNPLKLSNEEGRDFVGFWKDFTSEFKDEDDELSKPINRFNQMHSAESKEDQIINCMIGLEETLLKGASGSGNFRLAARATMLLSDEADDGFVFDFFQELYKVRNGIVHRDDKIGNREVGGTDLHSGEFASKSRYFLAKVIRRYLELRGTAYKNVTEVNRDLLRPMIVNRLKQGPITDSDSNSS